MFIHRVKDGNLVHHPSHFWPQYSTYVIPGSDPALQIPLIICLVLDVRSSSARLRGLQDWGSPAPQAMQSAVTMLLLWCPHLRSWWALQSLLVCQVARSWLAWPEKESCDLSQENPSLQALVLVSPLQLGHYIQEQWGRWCLRPCANPACPERVSEEQWWATLRLTIPGF